MEVLGAPSTFRSPFFLGSPANPVAVRLRPPAYTPFRRPPPPYLSYTPFRRLAAYPSSAAAGPPTPPASADVESRAILSLFLTRHGMRSDLTDGEATALDEIVKLLSSKLRYLHESEQLLGVQQLDEPQLTDLFTPYLRLLLCEYGIVGVDVQLPSSAPAAGEALSKGLTSRTKRVAQLEMQLLQGCPPPQVLHLMNFGLDLHQILSMARKYNFPASATIKQKLDRVREFLIGLGVCKSNMPLILRKFPQLLFLNIEETIIPRMAFLESYGVDKAKWSKIICRHPAVLAIKKAKVEALVAYFSEMGLSATDIGRILTQSPTLLSFSIETRIKLINMFFVDNGFTMEEIRDIILVTQGIIYDHSLERNLKPKWDFFLTMGYPRLDLVKFPTYFGFSLEKRIKPRYKRATELGIRWSMSWLFSPSNPKFEEIINKKIKML